MSTPMGSGNPSWEEFLGRSAKRAVLMPAAWKQPWHDILPPQDGPTEPLSRGPLRTRENRAAGHREARGGGFMCWGQQRQF